MNINIQSTLGSDQNITVLLNKRKLTFAKGDFVEIKNGSAVVMAFEVINFTTEGLVINLSKLMDAPIVSSPNIILGAKE